jgi:hypothetical protein
MCYTNYFIGKNETNFGKELREFDEGNGLNFLVGAGQIVGTPGALYAQIEA